MNKNFLTPGIADNDFIRGEVPITKEEVREISICKLHLKSGSVLYDIGSGTGSIAVESALLDKKNKVYAIESNPSAVELIKENAKKFECTNIEVVEGTAPEFFMHLEKPTHAFIGGSGGKLNEIFSELYKKNSEMRIVLNAVTMETIFETQKLLKEFPTKNLDVVQIAVNKINKLGNYHMLMANNPVFIFSFDFGSEK